jgi:hypothetical protein
MSLPNPILVARSTSHSEPHKASDLGWEFKLLRVLDLLLGRDK